jgi:N,N-dimethyltransferase/O-methyltransferase
MVITLGMVRRTRQRQARFEQVIDGALRSVALHAVFEIGVFEVLAHGPATLSSLSSKTRVVPGKLGPFVDALCAMGLLTRCDGRYQIIPGDEALLRADGDVARILAASPVRETFSKLAGAVKVLRSGSCIQAAGSGGEVGPEERRRFLAYLHSMSGTVAREVAGILGRVPFGHVLDLGCGPGTYSLELLRGMPKARATMVDRSDAIKMAESLARTERLAERMTFLAHDVGKGVPGGLFDLVVLSNLIHCYSPAWNRRLLKRVRSRLSPGGRIAIKDYSIRSDCLGPPSAVMFRLSMAMFAGDGDVYSAATVRNWLVEAGYGEIRRLRLKEDSASYLFVGANPSD